jgi:ABC-type branched-subunit amino acid transport system substrate-binding protein
MHLETRKKKKYSRAKAQRRKALPRFHGFLCAFAPLRERSPFLILVLLIATAVTAQTPLSPQESRGKEIYLLGASKSDKDILAYIGESSLEVPGASMACANCHGLAGQGKSEGSIDPSNITWEALTKPYGVTHGNGRKHPAYTPRGLELAITRGLDPAGNKLLQAMPRYQMSKEDLDDLVVYLKRLGTDVDPGISEDKILIGTALPASGPVAEMGQAVKEVITAYFAEVNSQGGIYHRRLELKSVATGDTPAGTRANLETLIKDDKVFAMTSTFIAGAEREVVPVLAQWEVPLVGPITIDPPISTPLNRQIFYLLSGNTGQARALVSFVGKKQEAKSGLAIVYHRTDLNLAMLDAIKLESEKAGFKAAVYEYEASNFHADEYIKQIRENPPAMVFFLGSVENLMSFLREAEKVSWFPEMLLPAGGVGAALLEAPAGFSGKLFFALPTAPVDQTADGLKEFRALAEKYKLPQKHLAAQVTAFSSAKALVEALRRAGKDLSREKLIRELEGFYEYQTGLTPAITYGPNRRVGAMGAYVLSVDSKEKKFVPVSGWVGIN